ncbi:TPA: hypothetical protein L4R50_000319 [Pseudomonas aeruginosa]|nr:hypothetical protein [Pseudomonas aeruginosa]HBP1602406.1 hypothetical protein [Pseudomonas aeruginosa]
MDFKSLGLHAPTLNGGAKAGAYIGIACAVMYLLISLGAISPWMASALLMGIAGAELASAFGVSYKKQGAVALLLVCASSALLAALCLLVVQVSGFASHILS